MRPPGRSHLHAPVWEAGGEGQVAAGRPRRHQALPRETRSAGQPAVERGRPHILLYITLYSHLQGFMFN